jgi:hypothetical protein
VSEGSASRPIGSWISPPWKVKGIALQNYVTRVRLISPLMAFDPRPDRGRPAQQWLVGPHRATLYKGGGEPGLESRGSPEPPFPTYNPNRSRGSRCERWEAPPPSLHRAPLLRPSLPVSRASPANEMAASGSNSTAHIPTYGLHHLTPFSLSSSLTVLVDLILGFVVYTRNDKVCTPLDLCPNGAILITMVSEDWI